MIAVKLCNEQILDYQNVLIAHIYTSLQWCDFYLNVAGRFP